ncbi:GL18295 [Drosophila persimilis]|uniref:GL18295 n=1 Tax=Drosophila persimilis TaxID=7234 RepID=B4H4N6_DROPE|nr:GL18295 [Drosophila persimilis]
MWTGDRELGAGLGQVRPVAGFQHHHHHHHHQHPAAAGRPTARPPKKGSTELCRLSGTHRQSPHKPHAACHTLTPPQPRQSNDLTEFHPGRSGAIFWDPRVLPCDSFPPQDALKLKLNLKLIFRY